MKVFFAVVGAVGLLMLLVSYWQLNAPADAWPQDWDQPAAGAIMLLCAMCGELVLWCFPC